MANEFTRITHTVSSGTQLVDINPNKLTTGIIAGYFYASAYQNDCCVYLPVGGYANISIFPTYNSVNYYRWHLADGTETSNVRLTWNTWNDLIKPDNAVCLVVESGYPTQTQAKYYYSFTN